MIAIQITDSEGSTSAKLIHVLHPQFAEATTCLQADTGTSVHVLCETEAIESAGIHLRGPLLCAVHICSAAIRCSARPCRPQQFIAQLSQPHLVRLGCTKCRTRDNKSTKIYFVWSPPLKCTQCSASHCMVRGQSVVSNLTANLRTGFPPSELDTLCRELDTAAAVVPPLLSGPATDEPVGQRAPRVGVVPERKRV